MTHDFKTKPSSCPLNPFLYIRDKPMSYFVLSMGVVLVMVCWCGSGLFKVQELLPTWRLHQYGRPWKLLITQQTQKEIQKGLNSKIQQRVLMLLDCNFLSPRWLGFTEIKNAKTEVTKQEIAIHVNRGCFDSPMSPRQCGKYAGGGFVMAEYMKAEGRLGQGEGRSFVWLEKQKADLTSICSGRRKQQVLLTLAQELLLRSE